MARSFSGNLLFLYIKCINFRKKISFFTSLPFKNHLINAVVNLILYNYGGSSLHVLSLKALTQVICPGDFRVSWSFLASRFILFLYKFREKHHFHEPSV
jgi:hypothetical protein